MVPFRTATRVWFGISLRTFGGPAGQIAVMHRELVDERCWFGEQRFLHALSYCTLLPGPEAQQLAIYLGWLLNGTAGGLVAGSLFVLPGYLALMALSAIYAQWGATTAVTAVFAGLAPAVLAIVAQAVWRIGRRALSNRILVAIAVGAFVALFVFDLAFPIVIAAAGLIGFLGQRVRPELFVPKPSAAAGDSSAPLIADDALHGERPTLKRAARIVAIGVVLWAAPIVVAAITLGHTHVLVTEGAFFSGTAVVVFGGAYAVLSFVAQRAVSVYHWLLPGDPAVEGSGVLGATLVVWVTFVPCFLFVFLGAPYVERLRHNQRLSAALTGITAAVVGVIANLSVYFSVHTLFSATRTVDAGPVHVNGPLWHTISPRAIVVTLLAFGLVFGWKLSVMRVLAVCAAFGAGIYLLR